MTGHGASGAADRRTPLIVPSPASATSTTRSGRSAAARSTAVAVGGERRAHAAGGLDQADPDDRRPRQLVDQVGHGERGRPRASAAIGGAIATGYQRCWGHTAAGCSPVAWASSAASVSLRSSPASYDWAGLRATTISPRRRSARAQPARHPGLADLGAGAGDQRPAAQAGCSHRHGPAPSPSGVERRQPSRSTCSSVWAADSATRRRDVPGGHRRRADGGHEQALRAAGRRRRPARRASSPSTTGTIGVGCPGRSRSTWRRSRATSARALGRPHDPHGGQRGGHVGGGRRGGEDERAGTVAEQVDVPPGPGDEPAERAERLGQRAHPQHGHAPGAGGCGVDAGARARRAPRRAPERAVAGAHVDQRGDVDHVAVHRERAVGHDQRRAPPAAVDVDEQLGQVVEVGVAVDPHLGPGQAGAVDDRRVVELVGQDRHVGARRASRAARGWRRTRWGTAAPPRRPSTPPARPRARRGAGASRRPAGTRPVPAPQRSRAAWAAATTARVVGQPEVVVGGEGDDRRARRARRSRAPS